MTRPAPTLNLSLLTDAAVTIAVALCVALSGCGLTGPATAPGMSQAAPRAAVRATAQRPAIVGAIALSEYPYVTRDNPDGWSPWVLASPGETVGRKIVNAAPTIAKIAKGYGCGTVYCWTGFGGSRYPHKGDSGIGYVPPVTDAAQGVTLQDIREWCDALNAEGIRPGIIVRPQRIVQGVNRPMVDGSNPVGTLIFDASMAMACGFVDYYADTPQDCDYPITTAALPVEKFGQFANRFPDARIIAEYWGTDYSRLPNVIHLCRSEFFKGDHQQAVIFQATDLDRPAKLKAWAAKLKATGSTVFVNCRPDDPSLPGLQANVTATWRAAFGGPTTQPGN